jgi:hypothetical protein
MEDGWPWLPIVAVRITASRHGYIREVAWLAAGGVVRLSDAALQDDRRLQAQSTTYRFNLQRSGSPRLQGWQRGSQTPSPPP